MSKKIIRLTESELKNYIRKVISEQGSIDPTSYESNINGDDNTPKQTGEPIIPYEKKGSSVPTSYISPEDLAKSIAGIVKAQEGAKMLQYIKQWGHTSKESWDACMKGGYYPYTSPELQKQAKNGRYFPFPNMASKMADDKRRGVKKPHSFALLIANLKNQLTETGFKDNGNNTYVGKVRNNNASIVFSDKSVTVAKKPVVPPSIDGHGMGLLFSPLVMDYGRIDAMTFKKQVMDYLNR